MINRPWSLQEMFKLPGFAERVTEQYVYIAETDHLLLQDPNPNPNPRPRPHPHPNTSRSRSPDPNQALILL